MRTLYWNTGVVFSVCFPSSIVTCCERVCISVAGQRKQEKLDLSPSEWDWTPLTGIVSICFLLLFTRFCFGMGQAGGDAASTVSSWFPVPGRAGVPCVECGWRAAGMAGPSVEPAFTVATPLTENRSLMPVYLMPIYGGPAFQQPGIWAGCMDMGRNCSLPVRGFTNAVGQAGAFPLVLFGYLTMHSKPAQA